MACIGFAGVEAYDIILYIGRTIALLHKRILIVDLSGTDAMTKAIYHGMDMDSLEDIIYYRNINYVRRIPKKSELKDYKDGLVFVVYGFNDIGIYSIHLDILYLVTDSMPSNIDRVNKIMNYAGIEQKMLRLLVRDIVTIDDFDRTKRCLEYSWNHTNSEYLYYDIDDYENALRCQLAHDTQFRKISLRMKGLIITEIGIIIPDIKLQLIRKAFNYARKGAS